MPKQQHQKFAAEAVITNIDKDMVWFLNRCRTCSKKIEDRQPYWHFQEPGTKLIPDYRYIPKTMKNIQHVIYTPS